MLTVKDVIGATGGILLSGKEDNRLGGLSTDTRRIKSGELFVAVKGDRFDGHDFVSDAVSRKAGAVIVQEGCFSRLPLSGTETSFISVPDTIKALGDIACFYRSGFNTPFVGVTGSNGKTTTKEMIAAILGKRFNILKNFGTENNHIGVPLTLMRLNSGHEIAVLEMGTNHPGEIRRLSEIVRPQTAVITNIGPSHLEYLKDLDTVFKAKIEILENMSENDKIVVNGDDEYLSNLKTGLKIIRFGLGNEFDFFADRINIEPDGINFMLNGKWEINLSLMGRHNIYNALAAISVSWDFGVSIDDIKQALAEFRGEGMRMEVKNLGDIKVINDSYNSNPLSMRQAIEALKDMTTEGRKILIAGDMLELGNLSGRFHHLVGRQAVESGVDFIIAVGRLADHVAAGAYEAGMSRRNVKLCAVTKEAGEAAVNLVKKGDTVLVKGSRSMRMEDIVKELEARFNSNVAKVL